MVWPLAAGLAAGVGIGAWFVHTDRASPAVLPGPAPIVQVVPAPAPTTVPTLPPGAVNPCIAMPALFADYCATQGYGRIHPLFGN